LLSGVVIVAIGLSRAIRFRSPDPASSVVPSRAARA